LNASRSPVFNLGDRQPQFAAILDNANYLTRVVDRLELRVKDLYDHYSTNIQERTNKRLAVLTVISAIFLPLTLIAGIYGMNFEHMIMIEWKHGYAFTMTGMVVLAIGLVVLFWKKGWFD
jgi:magnesium transporter